MTVERMVIMVCGPPGAGKTTRAQALAQVFDLTVYDLDDEPWSGDEGRFRRALVELRRDPAARAVVIRCAATRARRDMYARMCGATDLEVLAPPADECKRRVVERGRGDVAKAIRGIDTWFRQETGELRALTSRRW